MKKRLTMIAYAEEYLAHRRRLGYLLKGDGQQLLHFARFVDALGHRGPVTVELAVAWSTRDGASSERIARRLSIVRGFAQHRSLFDPATEIPPSGMFGPSRSRHPPYIYSEDEISLLLHAAAQLRPVDGLRPRTYAALLGTLLATGLRISEAMQLARSDVDLDSGILTVLHGKYGKSRLVPLHPSTKRALRRYARFRDGYHARPIDDTFFLNESGKRLRGRTVTEIFSQLRRKLTCTNGRPPRIHDLRHTMAVRRLLRWYEEKADVGSKIAALSTYLGHVEIRDTYWYLTAVPELMALTAARFESYGRRARRRS